MNAEYWRKLDELFHDAVGCADDERRRMLARGCGDDEILRADVLSLLDAHERASSFISDPAFDIAPRAGAPEASVGAGQQIGRYTLRRILGTGGMGVVWEADQDRPRRSVALKVVRPGLLGPGLARRFEHEAETLARLQHAGIAQIIEAGTHITEAGTVAYFAMELVRGEPITGYAQRKQLDLRDRLGLFVQVCAAVEHAHQRGVIHRDLKPGNILVVETHAESPIPPGSDSSLVTNGSARELTFRAQRPKSSQGQPKILDFGVARTMNSDVQITTLHTDVGQILGTVPYMSPEQIEGRPDGIDTRSDVYSLGVLLFELLAGRLPYDLTGKNLPEAARIIQNSEPTRLSSVHAVLRGDLEIIVGKALAKEPARRYASVSQLAADVTRYLRNEPISARPAGVLYQLRKLAGRHKLPFFLVALLMLLVAVFAPVAALQAVRLRAERDKARVAQEQEAAARVSAEEVATFLENLFEQADPGAQDSPDPKLRDLLEAGVMRLESDLADQPLVYARLAHVLGGVYAQLADFPRARGLLESAIQIRRRELGATHPDVAASLRALANTLMYMGENDQAHTLGLEALEIARAHFGETHEQVAAALEDVGSGRFYAADYTEAADYLQKSLDMRRALGAADSLDIAQSLHNLGHALQQLGRLNEAERTLLMALDIKRRLGATGMTIGLTYEALAHVKFARGETDAAEQYVAEQVAEYRRGLHAMHPKVAEALNNLAFMVNQNRGPTEALPIYREALAIRRTSLGDRHPKVAWSLNDLGLTLLDLGEYAEAQVTLEESLSILREHFPGEDARVANCLNSLGHAYYRSRAFGRAEPLQREALAMWRSLKGDEDAIVAVGHQSLGATLTGEGDFPAAEVELLAAAGIYGRLNHPNLRGVYHGLGNLCLEQGDFKTAERYHRRALEVGQRLPADRGMNVANALNFLGAAVLCQDRIDEAEPMLSEALESLRKLHPPGHTGLVSPLANLGWLRQQRGQAELAEELAREAVDVASTGMVRTDLGRADALTLLGSLLSDRDESPGAEPLLREAVNIFELELGPDRWRTARAQLALGLCLIRQQRLDEAEPLLQASQMTFLATLGEDHAWTMRSAQAVASLHIGMTDSD